MSSWSPCLVRLADSASRIMPAQVPQVDRRAALTNSRSGSSKPDRSATSAIAVDSPPGMISAEHAASCVAVRTSTNDSR